MSTELEVVPAVEIPEVFEVLRRPKRFKVFFGGRGSAKSESFARQLCLNAESRRAYKVLCAREFQNSIEDSVYGMLSEFNDIYRFGFDVQARTINTVTGGGFMFQGLARNLSSIKSKFGYDVCWIEEAETVTQKTWDTLIPTFRKSGSEIWISFNPDDEMGATYQQWVAPYQDAINRDGFYEDADIYIARVNYDQNPFFPDELRSHADALKASDYKKWLHVYGGEPNVDYEDSIIEPEWFDAAVNAHVKIGFTPRGERVAGFDVADTGRDAKAIALRYGVLVDECDSWLTGDVTDGAQKATDKALAYGCSDLVYDSIGNGAAVKTYATMGGKPVGLTFTGFGGADGVDFPDVLYEDSRTNKDMFRNKRAQYYWLLAQRFYRTWQVVEKGAYFDPDTLISINPDMQQLKQLKSELVKIQRKHTPGMRLIQIESKIEMKKRGIPSPNLADALMMAWGNPPKSFYKRERRAPMRRR